MTMNIRTSRLAMLGASAIMCAFAAQATAQEGPQGLKTNNLGQTLTLGDEATVSQEIDINFDGIPDFVVKITTDEQLFQNEAPVGRLAPGEFLEAGYILSLGVDNPIFSSVFFDLEDDRDGTIAKTFDLGDVVGEGFLTGQSRIPATSSAILYASVDSNDRIFSNGPFREIGDTGFLGFASFDPETEDTNFGFLEITRGSLAFGNLGFQQTANLGATVATTAAVPLPAPLALLGFAIAGLFGLRRFGKS